MPELRWILGVVGVVFLVGLIVRDRMRARRNTLPLTGRDPVSAVVAKPATVRAPEAAAPSQSATAATSSTAGLASGRHRDQPHDLPVIEINDGDAIDVTFASDSTSHRREPRIESLRVEFMQPDSPRTDVPTHEPPVVTDILAGEGVLGPARVIDSGYEAPFVPAQVEDASEAPWEEPIALGPEPELRVEWPAETERRIVSIRVVPRSDRFSGRSVRQALTGEGLRYGPMDIFHASVEDGRVVFSAASLTKPGVFNLDEMDGDRFAGLNLFAVLPGPMPAESAVDRLVDTARALAARLNGDLLDRRGEPLTSPRIAEIRATVAVPVQ